MAPKGTCRGRSTRVGQVARAALKRNFHRAAGRILCRRLKYATGYCDQRLGFDGGCIVPTLVKIFPRQPSLIPDVHRFASDSIFCHAHKGESHAL
ncbi:hypothetical protein V6N13_089175 [Hibiscus sabdariffa]